MLKEIKCIEDRNNLFAYPYFNTKVDVKTDSSESKLGAVNNEERKIIHLYSRKFTKPLRNIYGNEKITSKEKGQYDLGTRSEPF